uniref:Uncharacterized protein n=1 Tax=Myoviridae sp. ct3D84 TaxID=2825023 RepID=A0A8S5PBA1_9CAUD|nr:MAG TPA: hypothetical protein [Myoviridae sp. ct3D84]
MCIHNFKFLITSKNNSFRLGFHLDFLPYLVIIKVAGVRLPAHLVWRLSSGVLAEVATLFIYSLSIMRLTLSRSSSSVSQQVNRKTALGRTAEGCLFAYLLIRFSSFLSAFCSTAEKLTPARSAS